MKTGAIFGKGSTAWRRLALGGVLSGLAAALPAWSLDLGQAYQAAAENDASALGVDIMFALGRGHANPLRIRAAGSLFDPPEDGMPTG